MKYRGCAYYPEYWGTQRLEQDARLMAQAGINLARLGEFAWSRLEPREGHFDFGWLHQAVETLSRHGIQSLLCTPTAAPPVWLTDTYPDTVIMREDGRRASLGVRRHACPSAPSYRAHTHRIVTALAQEFADCEAVIGWQIDNELGPETSWCSCGSCQERFHQWLERRYGTVEELNARWRTAFWSQDYTEFHQVRLEMGANRFAPSRVLDMKRFYSDMMLEYAGFQADILRNNHPGARLTTNGMGAPLWAVINYYQLFGMLDVSSEDLYFDLGTLDADLAALDLFRSFRGGRPFWITETGSGALDWGKPPHPDQFRAWAWSGFAHGAEAWLVFRWRTCLSGQEQELQGILEHSGRPGHRYRSVQSVFTEFATLEDELAAVPPPRADVAMILDYDVLWAYEASQVGGTVKPIEHLTQLHALLRPRCGLVDIVAPSSDLSGYKLVILPSVCIVDAALADQLTRFAENGGIVFATGQTGFRDRNANYLVESAPDHLQDLLGLRMDGGMYLQSHMGTDLALGRKAQQSEIPLTGAVSGKTLSGWGRTWVGDVYECQAEVLLRFDGDQYQGQPALTRRDTGAGAAYTLALLDADMPLLAAVIEHVLDRAGIAPGLNLPPHVEAVPRGDWIFLINHGDQPVHVEAGHGYEARIGSIEDGRVFLAPYGVSIISIPHSRV